MKPEEWLRSTVVVKVRNKLATWSRDDVIAFAQQEFDGTDLTKMQVAELCDKLKHKNVEKPGKQFYPAPTLKTQTVAVEFRMVPNPGHTDWPETHWYLAGGRADLRFSGVEAAARWALGLMLDEPRTLWHELVRRWRDRNNLSRFDVNQTQGHPMAEILAKTFGRKLARADRLRTPLPDNTEIKKQYWGLDRGDRLVNQEGEAEVVDVRANLDTPPTITIKKVTSA